MTIGNATALLAALALLFFVASLLPQVPEKYTSAVGGILLAVAVLVGAVS